MGKKPFLYTNTRFSSAESPISLVLLYSRLYISFTKKENSLRFKHKTFFLWRFIDYNSFMQNLVQTYNHNKHLIKDFLLSSLKQTNLNLDQEELTSNLFKIFPSLELVYTSDKEYIQNSDNIYRDKKDSLTQAYDRKYLVHKTNDAFCFHEPYLSTATDHLCITIVCKTDTGYVFLDFRVRSLLERFDLIQTKKGMNLVNKIAYASIGGGLLFFSLFLVVYSFYDFAGYIFGDKSLSLETVFKPIIALTLGLAVYDLGKTILDEEVLPRTHHKSEGFNAKTLLKFSVSIIIALLIESLLVVFKISLIDYQGLPNAAILIASVSLLILVFAIFIYLTKKSE